MTSLEGKKTVLRKLYTKIARKPTVFLWRAMPASLRFAQDDLPYNTIPAIPMGLHAAKCGKPPNGGLGIVL